MARISATSDERVHLYQRIAQRQVMKHAVGHSIARQEARSRILNCSISQQPARLRVSMIVPSQCQHCNGSGSLRCTACQCGRCLGKGQVISSCPNCKGGRRVCSKCEGTGRMKTRTLFVFQKDVACLNCAGIGWRKCSSCSEGHMTTKCPDCLAGARNGCRICGDSRQVNCATCGAVGFTGLLESLKSLRETAPEDLPSAIRMGYKKQALLQTWCKPSRLKICK